MAVLATLSAGAAAYGILTIPDTTVPLPQSSSIHLLFSHSHLARAPIDVNVFLEQSSTLQPLASRFRERFSPAGVAHKESAFELGE